MIDTIKKTPQGRFGWHRWLSILLVGAMILWFVPRYHGPAAKRPDSSDGEISATRAMESLRRLLGDQSPHPAGSAANFAVRQRLVHEFESLGLEVEQHPFAVNGVAMQNILAHLPGDEQRRPILLATHYDSVEAGPGAGDAGSCVVALLETARVLSKDRKENGILKRDVYFLITDGEEWVRDVGHGLNGADYFATVQRPPLLERNPIVLNFDARGATGPSLLYETSPNNYALMKEVLPVLPRPVITGSSYVAVYDLLPNATDFTIFKHRGLEGLNFAFIAAPHRYHTLDDTIENLDPRSIQHHGENALAVTRFLLDDPRDDFAADENAVFFTILQNWTLCYPESLAVPLALMVLGIHLTGAILAFWHGRLTIRGIGWAAFCIVIAMTLSVALGWGVSWLHEFFPKSNHGFGKWDTGLLLTIWIAAFLSQALMLQSVSTTIDLAEPVWTVVWCGWAIGGVVMSWKLPGFSYIMLTVGVVPSVLSLLPFDKARLSPIAVGVAAIFLVPIAYQFGIALGVRMAWALGGLFFVLLTPIFPLMVSRPPTDQRENNESDRSPDSEGDHNSNLATQ